MDPADRARTGVLIVLVAQLMLVLGGFALGLVSLALLAFTERRVAHPKTKPTLLANRTPWRPWRGWHWSSVRSCGCSSSWPYRGDPVVTVVLADAA